MSSPIRLGVLGSGSGSNLQAILDAIHSGELNATVNLVLSDNPDGYILERARKAGIPSGVIDCHGYRNRFPQAVQEKVALDLKAAGCELVCLAGFMRLVKAPLLDAFPGKLLNIHPSLLPKFPGLHAWKQAFDAGETESGCTVHLVDAGMDTGPIIMQAKVPVLPGDTAAKLHQRIQVAEHQLYPSAIKKIATSMAPSLPPSP